MSGEPAVKRWVMYNGRWTLFNLRPEDPMYVNSAEYTGPGSEPAVPVFERPAGETVDNKARATRPGGRPTQRK